MWVYVQTHDPHEPSHYTVGFYQPDGKWSPASDHQTQAEAIERVHYLNGGEVPDKVTGKSPKLSEEDYNLLETGAFPEPPKVVRFPAEVELATSGYCSVMFSPAVFLPPKTAKEHDKGTCIFIPRSVKCLDFGNMTITKCLDFVREGLAPVPPSPTRIHGVIWWDTEGT